MPIYGKALQDHLSLCLIILKALLDSKALQWKEYWTWSQMDLDLWPASIRDALHLDYTMWGP